MAFAIIINGEARELQSGVGFSDGEGVQHPAAALTLWSDAERAAVGVFPITEPEAPAYGERVASTTLAVVGGQPVRQVVLEPVPLTELKAARKALVDEAYLAHLAPGCPVTIDGQAETLQLRNAEDRTNWLGVLAGAQAGVAAGQGASPYPSQIRTSSNLGYTISNSQAVGLMFALLAWAGSMFQARSDLKDAIEAAADAAAVAAVDLEAGWPA